jgi:hypothetical protein
VGCMLYPCSQRHALLLFPEIKTFVGVGGSDVLRDEAIGYAGKLRKAAKANVDVKGLLVLSPRWMRDLRSDDNASMMRLTLRFADTSNSD